MVLLVENAPDEALVEPLHGCGPDVLGHELGPCRVSGLSETPNKETPQACGASNVMVGGRGFEPLNLSHVKRAL